MADDYGDDPRYRAYDGINFNGATVSGNTSGAQLTATAAAGFGATTRNVTYANQGAAAVPVVLYGISNVAGYQSPIPLKTVVVAATSTVVDDDENSEVSVPSGYAIWAVASGGVVTVSGTYRWTKGSG
jgi:hypothetical protein